MVVGNCQAITIHNKKTGLERWYGVNGSYLQNESKGYQIVLPRWSLLNTVCTWDSKPPALLCLCCSTSKSEDADDARPPLPFHPPPIPGRSLFPRFVRFAQARKLEHAIAPPGRLNPAALFGRLARKLLGAILESIRNLLLGCMCDACPWFAEGSRSRSWRERDPFF